MTSLLCFAGAEGSRRQTEGSWGENAAAWDQIEQQNRGGY